MRKTWQKINCVIDKIKTQSYQYKFKDYCDKTIPDPQEM